MLRTFAPKWNFVGPILPKWIMKRKDISLGAKMLYALMASCAYDGSDNCHPSQGWLADNMGASVRSIQNYLRELERLELIHAERNQSGSSCRYFFLQADMVEIRQSKYPSKQPAFNNHSPATNNIGVRKLCVPPLPACQSPGNASVPTGTDAQAASDSANHTFAQLWAMWPRHEAKTPALREWRKLWFSGVLPPFEELLQLVASFKQYDRAWLRGYAPYLINWLRNERWKDQPTTMPETPPATPSTGKKLTPEEQEASLRRFREIAQANDMAWKQKKAAQEQANSAALTPAPTYANLAGGVRKVCVPKEYIKYSNIIPPYPPAQNTPGEPARTMTLVDGFSVPGEKVPPEA